jgi:hypothetical protein
LAALTRREHDFHVTVVTVEPNVPEYSCDLVIARGWSLLKAGEPDMNNDIRELSIEDLEHVAGGNNSQVNQPWYRGPKMHAPGSIAQGDTLDNTLTFDQLP